MAEIGRDRCVVVLASMELIPLRLRPGDDLKQALESWVQLSAGGSAWVVSGIGSLAVGQLRLAGRSDHTVLKGDLEILTLQGSLCSDGSHLHIAVADANGSVLGGHLCAGSLVRTTAEVLIARLPQWQLGRVLDPSTRYPELQIRSRVNRSRLLRWREWCRRIVSR